MPKTKISEINQGFYDFKNDDNFDFKMKKGLSPEIVKEISQKKNEPKWVLDIRLKALEVYEKLDLPTWGPDLSELNMDEISTYVKPKTDKKESWEDVPQEIKDTFDKLGIPKAEHEYLAGVCGGWKWVSVFSSMVSHLTPLR